MVAKSFKSAFFIGALVILNIRCDFFTKEERLVLTKTSANGQVVKFYYVTLDATTEDVLQLRKINNDQEVFVAAYKHNYIKDVKFIGSDSLFLVLSDTSEIGMSKNLDSIRINVRDGNK